MKPRRYQLVLAGGLVGGVSALWFGFSLDWDLLNYHLYNPHALLTGRGAGDIAVAQQQTYFNPTFYIPVYLLFKYFPTPVLVFLVGAVQGAQLLLVYLIGERIVSPQIPRLGLLVAAALGFTGPVFLSQLGATPADTILSALVLGGLVTVLSGRETAGRAGLTRGLSTGFLLGLAVAFKLTFVIYAAAMGLALLLAPPKPRFRNLLPGYSAGLIAGFLVGGGFWFLQLWSDYGNPFFPFFNGIFESPWSETQNYRDLRFMPRIWYEWFFYPFVWLTDARRVWEVPFRDLRLVLLYPVMILLPALCWKHLGQAAPSLRFLLVFMLLGFVGWILLFSIYRYLAVLEMLAGITLFACVTVFTTQKKWMLLALGLLLGSQFFVDFSRPPSSWELHADAQNALSGLPDDAMLVMDGYEPLGYLAFWVPKDVPIIRLRANFMKPDNNTALLYRKAEMRVAEHRGPVYLVNTASQLQAAFLAGDLNRAGLEFAAGDDCKPVFSDAGLQQKLNPVLCRLRKAGG